MTAERAMIDLLEGQVARLQARLNATTSECERLRADNHRIVGALYRISVEATEPRIRVIASKAVNAL